MFAILTRSITFGGSLIGSPNDSRKMLDLFAEKGVKSWVNTMPMKEANKALVEFEKGVPRYRFVLVNDGNLG